MAGSKFITVRPAAQVLEAKIGIRNAELRKYALEYAQIVRVHNLSVKRLHSAELNSSMAQLERALRDDALLWTKNDFLSRLYKVYAAVRSLQLVQ
jgi:hypothetical protein